MPNLTIRHAAVAKGHANSVADPPLAPEWITPRAASVTARLPGVAAPLPVGESLPAMNHHIHIMLAQASIADRHAAARLDPRHPRHERATWRPPGATVVARLAAAIRTSR
jgi:hypothetical protein